MDAQFWEVLGKYAGLAGFCVALILLIFRAILKKNIFPELNTEQAYSLLKLLITLTFSAGILGIGAWAFVSGRGPTVQPGDLVPSAVITGHVISQETGKAIDDAEVTLSGRTETTHSDGAGNFTLTIIPPLPPDKQVHLYITKDVFKIFDRNVTIGENLEAELMLDKSPVPRVGPKPPAFTPPPPTKNITATWTDSDTGLMWASDDNGSNLTYQQAFDYCRSQKLNGRDWRLPTIEELKNIYSQDSAVSGQWMNGPTVIWHIKGNLHPSGWTWSSSGNSTDGVWHISFKDAAQYITGVDNWYDSRALCVRKS
jgi:hypothetical protein